MNFVEKVKILQNYFKAGNFKKVIEGCETLNKKFPENSFVLNLLGMAYQELQKNYKAIDYFELALKADQSNIAAMNNLANSLKNTGEFEKADEIFKKILRIDPNYINVYNNYANLKSTVNDVEGAILLYNKGLVLAKEKNINPINFLFHLASSFQSLNKKKELMEIINEIFKIDPDDINANKTLSSIYKYSKENHEAMTHLAKMKNISKKIDLSDNQKKTIFFSLGKAFDDLKDPETAVRYLSKANQLFKKINKSNIIDEENVMHNMKKIFKDIDLNISHKHFSKKKLFLFVVCQDQEQH